MKSITLDKNSWHYWLAKQGGFQRQRVYDSSSSRFYYQDDICYYTRKVILGSIYVLIKSLGIAMATALYALGGVYLYVITFVHLFDVPDNGLTVLGVLAFGIINGIAIVYGIIHGGPYIQSFVNRYIPFMSMQWDRLFGSLYIAYRKRRSARALREPGFLTLAYASMKDKVCFTIDFKDSSEDKNENSNS